MENFDDETLNRSQSLKSDVDGLARFVRVDKGNHARTVLNELILSYVDLIQ